MGNGNVGAIGGPEVLGFCVIVLFILPAFIYAWLVFKNWIDGDTKTHHGRYPNYYNSAKDTSREPHVSNRAHLKVKEMSRSRPPNASFFGRIDGKEVSTEGPYEEQFLNKQESLLWEIKKKREILAKMDAK